MRRKFTTKEFQEKLNEKYGDKYTLLSEYTRSSEKIKVKNNKCGHIWTPKAGSLLHGSGCPICHGRMTKEDFENKILEEVGDEYSVLGEYVNHEVPILMKHNKCGHEWFVRPTFFTGSKKTRCPQCNRGPVSQEEANKRLHKKFGKRFIIKEYTYITKPALIYDNFCNHEYTVVIEELLIKNSPNSMEKCPICKNNKLKKIKEQKEEKNKKFLNNIKFKKENIEKKFPNYTFLWSNDNSLAGKINVDGQDIYCDNITIDYISKKLVNHTLRVIDTDSLVKKVKNEYDVLSEYTKSIIPVKFKHKACGTEFIYKPGALISRLNQGKITCPKCGGKKGERKTNKQFQEELNNKFGVNVFLLESDYLERRKPVTVRHKCGNIYNVLPETLLDSDKISVSGCPACGAQSNGEIKITNFLKQNNINFKSQFVDERCKLEKSLRFDFAILDDNNNVKHLIEFDGQQHFYPVELWGGNEEFKKTQQRDRIKDEFCEEYNINLIRIRYNQIDQIDTLLQNILQ